MGRLPEVLVTGLGLAAGLGAKRVQTVVHTVLQGERTDAAGASVTFLSAQRMRALNRRTFGRDRATDVIAFGLLHAGRLMADIYVCPAVARRAARSHGHSVRQELVRLLVHGALHADGWDHPEGRSRESSPMWARQERYVGQLAGTSA